MQRINVSHQSGIVLFTALVFLIVVTMIGVASMRSSTLELRMSLNEESRVSAFQQAQALTDAIIFTPSTTPVVGGVGYRICTPSVPAGEPCNQRDLFVPNAFIGGEVATGRLAAVVGCGFWLVESSGTKSLMGRSFPPTCQTGIMALPGDYNTAPGAGQSTSGMGLRSKSPGSTRGVPSKTS